MCASLLLTRWRCPLFPTPPPAVPSLFLSQGTVEKQQSLFFMISVTEEMARDGLVLRCMSTNKSRFKLVVSHYFSSNIVQVYIASRFSSAISSSCFVLSYSLRLLVHSRTLPDAGLADNAGMHAVYYVVSDFFLRSPLFVCVSSPCPCPPPPPPVYPLLAICCSCSTTPARRGFRRRAAPPPTARATPCARFSSHRMRCAQAFLKHAVVAFGAGACCLLCKCFGKLIERLFVENEPFSR